VLDSSNHMTIMGTSTTETEQHKMQQTSLEIIRNLPHYSDAQLRQLKGLLCLDAYGAEVGTQVARHFEAECDRRKALMNEVMDEVVRHFEAECD